MNTDVLAQIQQYIPLLIPIAIIQLGLLVAALIDIIKRERTRGPKWVWILVVIFFNLFGPIVYFIFGRNE
ncbi:MAG: PLD nuclease N-terminal domain-containing protein [Saprospiraceae bacterium]|nr:PLD nuclease N-terminal domain-containing protein [Saprospiraceae bacterium]